MVCKEAAVKPCRTCKRGQLDVLKYLKSGFWMLLLGARVPQVAAVLIFKVNAPFERLWALSRRFGGTAFLQKLLGYMVCLVTTWQTTRVNMGSGWCHVDNPGACGTESSWAFSEASGIDGMLMVPHDGQLWSFRGRDSQDGDFHIIVSAPS